MPKYACEIDSLLKLFALATELNASLAQHVNLVCEFENTSGILLVDQNCQVLRTAQRIQKIVDLIDHLGRQSQRRLVDKQEPGPRHQGASYHQHLLLAARKLAPCFMQSFLAVAGNDARSWPSRPSSRPGFRA